MNKFPFCMHYPKTMDEITAHLHHEWKRKLFATINPPKDELHKHGRIISRKTFIDNPDVKWNIYNLLDNDEITVDDIINNRIHTDTAWKSRNDFWSVLSRAKKTMFDYIFSHSMYQWNIRGLSRNPNLTMQIIQNNTNVLWDWDEISLNGYVPIHEIAENLELSWNWNYLTQNFNISYTDKLKYKHLPWNWCVFCNYNVQSYSLKYVVENLELPWDWKFMHRCDGITSDFVKLHLDKQWDWIGLLQRNIVNVDFVTRYCSQQLDWEPYYVKSPAHKQMFVNFWMIQTCLAIILEIQCSTHPISRVDYVFADEHIIKLIAKY